MYEFLSTLFVLTILFTLLIGLGLLCRPLIWRRHIRKIQIFCAAWFGPYLIFVLFFTGPYDLSQ
jgi:hypothetical protein